MHFTNYIIISDWQRVKLIQISRSTSNVEKRTAERREEEKNVQNQ